MSKPTREDGSLFLQLFGIIVSDEEMTKAYRWIANDLDSMNYDDFKVKYPKGSEGRRNLQTVASYMEVLSTFVNKELINEDLVFDIWGSLQWDKLGNLVRGLREETKMPRLFENYEFLARKYPKWEEKNPPKL